MTKHTPDQIRDISVHVYKRMLDADCKGNADRMLAKDADGGTKLRNRAAMYDQAVRYTLEAIGMDEPV